MSYEHVSILIHVWSITNAHQIYSNTIVAQLTAKGLLHSITSIIRAWFIWNLNYLDLLEISNYTCTEGVALFRCGNILSNELHVDSAWGKTDIPVPEYRP